MLDKQILDVSDLTPTGLEEYQRVKGTLFSPCCKSLPVVEVAGPEGYKLICSNCHKITHKWWF